MDNGNSETMSDMDIEPVGNGAFPTLNGDLSSHTEVLLSHMGAFLADNEDPARHNGDFSMDNEGLPIHNSALPTLNGDFSMHDGDPPLHNGDFPLHNEALPALNGDRPMQNGDLSTYDSSPPMYKRDRPTSNGGRQMHNRVLPPRDPTLGRLNSFIAPVDDMDEDTDDADDADDEDDGDDGCYYDEDEVEGYESTDGDETVDLDGGPIPKRFCSTREGASELLLAY